RSLRPIPRALLEPVLQQGAVLERADLADGRPRTGLAAVMEDHPAANAQVELHGHEPDREGGRVGDGAPDGLGAVWVAELEADGVAIDEPAQLGVGGHGPSRGLVAVSSKCLPSAAK